jgi:hypothetical protein
VKKILLFFLLSFLGAAAALAQAPALAPEGLWQGYDGEWEHVSQQLIALAEATPAEKFSWRPAAGVRSTGEVYMHIAVSNFYLLSVTGPKMPAELDDDDVDKNNLETRDNRLAKAFPGRREGRSCSGQTQRSEAQSKNLRPRCHYRWHLSPHHRSRQRAHGPANRLRPHDRRSSPLVQVIDS